MKQYLDMMRLVRETGTYKSDRTGTGTYSVFGHQMRFDLAAGFPMVTTKKCHLKSIVHELLWFLQGDTNIAYLKENGVSIWDDWADENGDLGPVYGYQWRSWPAPNGESIDQISNLIKMIKSNPDSRRLIVSAWNPALVDQMALPPCHALFQFYVADGKLSCQLYQRSADIFLGVPFNIASYALLTLMVAQVCDLTPGDFVWTGGDCHLYANHIEQTDLQLSRDPLPLPSMRLNPEIKDLFAFTFDDFTLEDYQSHPHIKVAMIAAMGRNRVIGCDNKMPWHLPEDLKYFKATTMGKPIVMGRKTFDSLGRPLPGRSNIVISRQADLSIPGVQVVDSIEQALTLARHQAELDAVDEIMIIGGGNLYEQCLALADRLYLTRVELEPQGDAWFPAFSDAEWELREERAVAEGEAYPAHCYQVLDRRSVA